MHPIKKYVLMIAPLAALSTLALGQEAVTTTTLVQNAMNAGVAKVLTQIQSAATPLLSALVMPQFTITNIQAMKADFDTLWAKFLGSMMWFSFCFYVMSNGISFLQSTNSYILSLAGNVAGGTFDAGFIMTNGIEIGNDLLTAFGNAAGTGTWSALTNLLPTMMVGLTCLVIMASCAVIALKIFIINIEMNIVIAVSPLSFSLLGLNALREQGIAPFKYLIAVAYRVLILSAVVSGMYTLSQHVITVFNSISASSTTSLYVPIFGAMFGYVILAFLALKSDSIAGTLASGSSNLSSGDVASAAAAGAAAGAALVTAGAATAAGGSAAGGKASEAMSSVMGKMRSDGGAISNASSIGTGASIGEAPGKNGSGSGPSGGTASATSAQGGDASGEHSQANAPDTDSPTSSETGSTKNTNGSSETSAPDSSKSAAAAVAAFEEGNAAGSGNPDANVGSAASAGIQGAAPKNDPGDGGNDGKNDATKPRDPNKPTLSDRLSTLNYHASQVDQGGVSVSINPHAE